MKTEQKSLRKQQQRQELYDVYEESEIEEEYIGVEDQKERDPLALSEKDPNDVVTENKSSKFYRTDFVLSMKLLKPIFILFK